VVNNFCVVLSVSKVTYVPLNYLFIFQMKIGAFTALVYLMKNVQICLSVVLCLCAILHLFQVKSPCRWLFLYFGLLYSLCLFLVMFVDHLSCQ